MERGRRRFLAIVGMVIAIIIVIGVFSLSRRMSPMTVTVLDVGQGDALFIETPRKRQMLIDGGPSSTVIQKLGRVMPFYDRSIDVIVLTNPDADHFVGLIEVLRRYAVGKILMTGVKKESTLYETFLATLRERSVPVTMVVAPDVLALDEETSFSILAPLESWEGRPTESINDTSIVGRLDYQDFSMLFTGDATVKVEEELLRNSAQLDADVLKVGHHGSKTSSSADFLAAVSPELAVVSLGKNNRYGHPHAEVLSRLDAVGIPLRRTDADGDIRIESFGEGFTTKQGTGLNLW